MIAAVARRRLMFGRSHPALAILFSISVLAVADPGWAQPPTTIGLIQNDRGAFNGYTLFECMRYTDTYLIDNNGLLVNSWQSQYEPGNMCYLLESGDLLRGANPGGFGSFNGPGGAGMAQRFDWDGNLLWEFLYSDEQVRHHHDLEPLPNGNVLMVAWELRTYEQSIEAGRDSSLIWQGEVWPEHIIEVEPVGATGGNIVWEWHAWDHLIQDYDATKDNFGVVADHPELININHGSHGNADWLHANAIGYNADLDQIVISVNAFNEFWIIDHSTTTAEAAGHTGGVRGMGGDLLYRWGNPQAYDRGTELDRKFYRQHNTHWIEPGLAGEGRILLYNNGNGRPEGTYSSIEEIETTVDANGDYPIPPPGIPHGPTAASWIYTATPPESLYSGFISGARRLPNGNTLICEGANGTLQEIDPQEDIVWLYINPVNSDGPMYQGTIPTGNLAFRATRYAPEYPGFDGRDLTPGDPIELEPNSVDNLVALPRFTLRQNHPNPFHSLTKIAFSMHDPAQVRLEIYDIGGRRVATLADEFLGSGEHQFTWRANGLPSGVYHYALRVGSETTARKLTVVR
jgi:hypothetical protein